MNPELNDQNLINRLIALREKDLDSFMQLVLETLKKYRHLAVEDAAEKSKKLAALSRLLDHMESKEQYEDCAFIAELKKQIDDAKGI